MWQPEFLGKFWDSKICSGMKPPDFNVPYETHFAKLFVNTFRNLKAFKNAS